MGTTLLMAVALVLIIEGIMPFISPGAWRETFRRILELSDVQLRFMGLTAMLSGVVLLIVAG